ncbi:hypothetical protein GGR52DRAFT_526192 [Hypoxylon sp. FL1284]|nr:hypothetical protein GGR52DRAFT_526192 [Hypoxylon sp. FL1284]
MEVLGAVAATGQLVGTVVGILDSINQLREFLKYAPARYHGWHTELDVLGETIACIKQNSLLQTCQVGRIVEEMAPKITTLSTLCALYAPQPKLRLYARLSRALSAKGAETRIFQSFESLEHDKTSLILTITTIQKSKADDSIHHTNRTDTSDTEDEPSHNQGSIRKDSLANSSSSGKSENRINKLPTMASQQPQGTSNFGPVTNTGDDCIVGHANKLKSNIIFGGVENKGHRVLLGAYTDKIFETKIRSAQETHKSGTPVE